MTVCVVDESGKEKADPCGMTKKGKSRRKSEGDGNQIDRFTGWNRWLGETHISESRCGAPTFVADFYTETSGLRNFFAAAVMSTMKRTSRRSWATLNGVSVPVG